MMKISVKWNTYLYLTLLLLMIPVQWIISWIMAIIIHELCHWIAVKICGGSILHIKIGIGGAQLRCSNLSDICRLFAIICGPLGGIFVIFIGKWFPRVALCSFFLSIYNLIPLLPLDGGQIFRILIKSDRIFSILQNVFLLSFILLALFATFYLHLGVLPMLVMLGIYLKCRKIPCKEGICRVQ